MSREERETKKKYWKNDTTWKAKRHLHFGLNLCWKSLWMNIATTTASTAPVAIARLNECDSTAWKCLEIFSRYCIFVSDWIWIGCWVWINVQCEKITNLTALLVSICTKQYCDHRFGWAYAFSYDVNMWCGRYVNYCREKKHIHSFIRIASRH